MPIVTIQAPTGEEVQIEAPEGATDEQIFMFAKSQGLFNQQQTSQQFTNEDVPLSDDAPLDQVRMAEANEQARIDAMPTSSFMDELIGVGEATLTTATGATTGAGAFLGGTIEGAIKELTGQIPRGEGQKLAQQRAAGATFAPRTKAGQENVAAIGEVLGVLPPVLGTTPLNTIRPLITGKAVTDRLLRSPRAKRQLLADEILKGNPNVELLGKALNESGEIITRPASKKAVKVLGGDHVARGTVSVLENMNVASKGQVNRMLSDIEKGYKNPLFADANRPSDVLGRSVFNRAIKVAEINERAGKAIRRTADSLKDVKVDIRPVSNSFMNALNDMGVTFSKGDDGWVTPDFSRSKFQGGSQKDMTVLVNDLLDSTPSFDVAHKLKRTIRDNIDYDKGGTGQVKGESQALLKSLSSGIDGVLDNTSPKYKKANESFARTIKVKNDFDKLMGKDIDLSNPKAASEILGGKAMRLGSNAVSRTAIKQLFEEADIALGSFGIKFKDDIPSLIHITGKLNEAFKLAPSGSLKGNIISGGLDVAEAASGTVGAARIASKALEKIKPSDFNKKIRAFRTLTTTQEK